MHNSVKWSHRAIQTDPSLYSIEAGILPRQRDENIIGNDESIHRWIRQGPNPWEIENQRESDLQIKNQQVFPWVIHAIHS